MCTRGSAAVETLSPVDLPDVVEDVLLCRGPAAAALAHASPRAQRSPNPNPRLQPQPQPLPGYRRPNHRPVVSPGGARNNQGSASRAAEGGSGAIETGGVYLAGAPEGASGVGPPSGRAHLPCSFQRALGQLGGDELQGSWGGSNSWTRVARTQDTAGRCAAHSPVSASAAPSPGSSALLSLSEAAQGPGLSLQPHQSSAGAGTQRQNGALWLRSSAALPGSRAARLAPGAHRYDSPVLRSPGGAQPAPALPAEAPSQLLTTQHRPETALAGECKGRPNRLLPPPDVADGADATCTALRSFGDGPETGGDRDQAWEADLRCRAAAGDVHIGRSSWGAKVSCSGQERLGQPGLAGSKAPPVKLITGVKVEGGELFGRRQREGQALVQGQWEGKRVEQVLAQEKGQGQRHGQELRQGQGHKTQGSSLSSPLSCTSPETPQPSQLDTEEMGSSCSHALSTPSCHWSASSLSGSGAVPTCSDNHESCTSAWTASPYHCISMAPPPGTCFSPSGNHEPAVDPSASRTTTGAGHCSVLRKLSKMEGSLNEGPAATSGSRKFGRRFQLSQHVPLSGSGRYIAPQESAGAACDRRGSGCGSESGSASGSGSGSGSPTRPCLLRGWSGHMDPSPGTSHSRRGAPASSGDGGAAKGSRPSGLLLDGGSEAFKETLGIFFHVGNSGKMSAPDGDARRGNKGSSQVDDVVMLRPTGQPTEPKDGIGERHLQGSELAAYQARRAAMRRGIRDMQQAEKQRCHRRGSSALPPQAMQLSITDAAASDGALGLALSDRSHRSLGTDSAFQALVKGSCGAASGNSRHRLKPYDAVADYSIRRGQDLAKVLQGSPFGEEQQKGVEGAQGEAQYWITQGMWRKPRNPRHSMDLDREALELAAAGPMRNPSMRKACLDHSSELESEWLSTGAAMPLGCSAGLSMRALGGSALDPKEYVLGQRYEDIRRAFVLHKMELGAGQFGVVRKCREILSGRVFACKVICKESIICAEDAEDIRREVACMRQLQCHPRFVNLHKVCEDAESVHIVMDLCAGGDLLDFITEHGFMTELQAAKLCRAMVEALLHCHCLGIVHRDVKPENILLTSATCDASCDMKLVDFGVATFFRKGEALNEIIGTPEYMAPEVLQQSYGPGADIWSAGVVLFTALSGVSPFWASDRQGMKESILTKPVSFKASRWANISYECKDLVSKMLIKEPAGRISATDILSHPWLKQLTY